MYQWKDHDITIVGDGNKSEHGNCFNTLCIIGKEGTGVCSYMTALSFWGGT